MFVQSFDNLRILTGIAELLGRQQAGCKKVAGCEKVISTLEMISIIIWNIGLVSWNCHQAKRFKEGIPIGYYANFCGNAKWQDTEKRSDDKVCCNVKDPWKYFDYKTGKCSNWKSACANLQNYSFLSIKSKDV